MTINMIDIREKDKLKSMSSEQNAIYVLNKADLYHESDVNDYMYVGEIKCIPISIN